MSYIPHITPGFWKNILPRGIDDFVKSFCYFFYHFALQVFHLLNLHTNEDSAKILAFTVIESLNRVPWWWALS
jgi:hypothetical protein